MAAKLGTRKRRRARSGLAKVQRALSAQARPWYVGRWAGTGRKLARGLRPKRFGL